jgi:hypothetical protein
LIRVLVNLGGDQAVSILREVASVHHNSEVQERISSGLKQLGG